MADERRRRPHTMTVKTLKQLLNNLDEKYDNIPILYPIYEEGFPNEPINFMTVQQCYILENNVTPDLGVALVSSTKTVEETIKDMRPSDFPIQEVLYPIKKKIFKSRILKELYTDGTLDLMNNSFEIYDADFEEVNGDPLCISKNLFGNLPYWNCPVTYIGVDDNSDNIAIYVNTKDLRKELNITGKDWIMLFRNEKKYFKRSEVSKELSDLFKDRIC